jgi:hypothetical protein
MTRADDIAVTNNQSAERSIGSISNEIVELLHAARAASVRSINALMTATYWEIGRRIVEFEQKGIHEPSTGKS